MHLMKHFLLLCAVVVLMGPKAEVFGQTRPAKGEGDENPGQYLGEYFVSRGAGLALRPPVGGTQIKPVAVGMNIVQYVNTEEKWALRVLQMVFEKPAAMVGKDDPSTPGVDESKTMPGVLAQTVQQLLLQNAGGKLLRQDVINVGKQDTGMIILRYTQGSQTYLRQAALIQRNDQHYYVLDLTSPSSRAAGEGEEKEDPSEAMAVRIFNAILDSVQILDLSLIQADNDARLYSARSLMVNMSARAKEVVAAEQYFRMVRNGKDVGWSFVAEELGQRLGENGVYVAILTEGTSEPGGKVNVATEAFCQDSRRSEVWVSVSVFDKGGQKEQVSEIGQSDRRTKPKLVGGGGDDRKNGEPPAISVSQRYVLNVTQTSKVGATRMSRELSPHYLPQVFAHLLPRLLPLREAKGYLYLVWVSGERELIHRYIDVEKEKVVDFGGRQVSAVVVKDRLGLEGNPTFHYLTAKGQYLGSETPATGVAMIATDQKTLSGMWPSAKIARPRVLEGWRE
ncbi:MAG: hypothetical protein NTU53_08770 [Planctomycetota bacterium]|nr:hypothetical protein [Planctomycetota bacterium]